MKTSRREWMRKNLAVAAITPTLLSAQKARSYKVDEIEKRLGSGKKIRGVTKLDLPTPSLLLDLDRLSANIAKMARYAEQASVELRPHAKTHKCPEVARRQLEAGALGVCTATIHEAEQMAAADIGGLLITSEQCCPGKVAPTDGKSLPLNVLWPVLPGNDLKSRGRKWPPERSIPTRHNGG